MSRARHKGKAGGGVVYCGSGSKVAQEAMKKAHGGSVPDKDHDGMKIGGRAPKKRMDKRARGGRVNATSSPMAPGSASHPFSSAAKG